MRKKTIMLWLLCLFTMLPMGATADTMEYTLSFSPSDFTVKTVSGDSSIITSTKYELYSNYDPTLPELPVIYVTYLLPPGMEYTGFTCSKGDNPFQPGVILKNGSRPVPNGTSSRPPQTPGYPSQIYPSSIEFVQTATTCGYRTVTFKVMPIRYDAIMHDLMVANYRLTLQLASAGTLSVNNGKRGERERNYVEEKIWNKDSLSAWYSSSGSASSNQWQNQQDNTIYKDKYLIITNNALKSSFTPLVEWKRLKGLDVETVTVEDIASEQQLAGPLTPKNIKQFLRNYYFETDQKENIDIYVLLGGDVNIIPIVYCKTPLNRDFDIDSLLLPSDMYYACVSDDYWDWDSNSNGILGEYQTNSFDNIVFFNDLYVSRASVRDYMEVEVFVNKVIQYESNPPLDNHWGESILFLGNHMEYDDIKILDGTNINHYDDEAICRQIIEDEIDSIRRNSMKYLCSTGTNLPYDNLITDAPYYVNSQRATEQFRSNYSLICEFSHGYYDLWDLRNYKDPGDEVVFDVSITDTIVSAFPKIVVSAACFSNGFDVDSINKEEVTLHCPYSLSESMLRSPLSGIVAFVGSSRCGYNVQDSLFEHTDIASLLAHSNQMNRDFVRCLYNTNFNGETIEEKKLGKAVEYTKRGLNPNDAIDRKLLYVVNTLGDPELNIYTEAPKQFTNTSLVVDKENNDFALLTGGVFGTKLYDTTTGKLYYSGENDSIHVIETLNLDSIDAVLMKENYVPLHIVLRSKYIQNETYENGIENITNHEYIYVGRDVTTNKPIGNVVIKQGSGLKLKANKEIMIKNGFSVENGGTFEMDIE